MNHGFLGLSRVLRANIHADHGCNCRTKCTRNIEGHLSYIVCYSLSIEYHRSIFFYFGVDKEKTEIEYKGVCHCRGTYAK